MKKTTSITLGVIMSAVILTNCGDDRRCVDTGGIVVPEQLCSEDDDDGGSSSAGRSFRWYYGGDGGRIGSKATGGSYTSVRRGGFGSSIFSHTSGGG